MIAENGILTKKVLRKLLKHLHHKARTKLAILDAIVSLEILINYPGLDFKMINNTYRIRFPWDTKNVDNVDIGDFH